MYSLESRFTVSRPVGLFVGMLSQSRLNIGIEKGTGVFTRDSVVLVLPEIRVLK